MAGSRVPAKPRRSTSLSRLQAELRLAVARIAALEAVLRLTPQGDVMIAAAGRLTLQAAAAISVEGALITLASPMVKAHGVVQCDVLKTMSVVAASYTPGAGNLV